MNRITSHTIYRYCPTYGESTWKSKSRRRVTYEPSLLFYDSPPFFNYTHCIRKCALNTIFRHIPTSEIDAEHFLWFKFAFVELSYLFPMLFFGAYLALSRNRWFVKYRPIYIMYSHCVVGGFSLALEFLQNTVCIQTSIRNLEPHFGLNNIVIVNNVYIYIYVYAKRRCLRICATSSIPKKTP